VSELASYPASPATAPQSRVMTIIAQDPQVQRDGAIVRARVTVPVDRLEPGPRSHRFHVVDYDATEGKLHPAADLGGWGYEDRFADAPDETLLADFDFHAQNVYAIAARTLARLEFALGRRIEWQFGSHQLYLVPHAFVEANAFYAREDCGVFFGYLPQNDGTTVHTCLSHDIVAHETTHAILDGLRPRFMEPGFPDQPAFHEALGDIVALLSVFSLPEVIEAALAGLSDAGRIEADAELRAGLAQSVLFGVAEEFGAAVSAVRGSSLRRSVTLAVGDGWKTDATFEEPHRRGEVLVAALMSALLQMWTERLETLALRHAISKRAAAEEGAKAADHLLTMFIRSLDYAPAIELEFDDVLDAMLVSDAVVAPDDAHDYRGAVRDAFARYGITQPQGRLVDVAGQPLIYDHVNAGALRANRDEVFRFVWQNLAALDLRPDFDLTVEAVRPATRIGPDGLLVQEVVADYIQVLDLTGKQATGFGLELPPLVGDDTPLQVWGGGTLIFDQFGRLKFHQRKALDDWPRQSLRIGYLARNGLFDTRNRLGFGRGLRFADLHAPDRGAGEQW
jgi:hypothetical protein